MADRLFWGLKRAVVTVVIVALAGCSSGDGEREDARAGDRTTGMGDGGRLVIGVQQEPERLTEILNATATTQLVCNLLFAKFVKYDDQLNLLPDMIERVPTVENGDVTADHLTYTYRLRKDVRWHDGTPVSSDDVRFTYDVIMHPDIVVESREGWDVIESVDTPDPHTVVFRLKDPYPDFVSETFLDEAVLPRHILGSEAPAEFHLAGFHRAPVGNGPFVFKEWVAGSHLTVVANPDYYGDGPYLDQIIFKFVPDENALLVQMKTGEIDLYDNANVTFIREADGIEGTTVYRTPTMMYEHLDLNNDHPILNDARVRRALHYATNRQEIIDEVYRGVMTRAPLDEHPSSRYFSPAAASTVEYNPLKARRLLRDAGWMDQDGDGILEKDGRPLSLTITATSGNPDREKTELVLQRQYREVGVDLRIKNYNATVLYGSYEDNGVLKKGEFDIAMYAWLSSPEPGTKTALYGSDNIPPNGQNHPRIRHAQLTELLETASTEVDPDKRVTLYHRAADILVLETPVIPLFWYTTFDICREELHNYHPNPTPSSDTWNANTWRLVDPAGPSVSSR